jgi:hypothetical protein
MFDKHKFLLGLDQTEDICLEAVSEDGLNLKYVLQQTDKICLAAIKQNPKAIKFVHPHAMSHVVQLAGIVAIKSLIGLKE